MEPIQIPQHIDDPINFLLWDIRDVVPVVAGMVVGILLDQFWIFFLIGAAIAKFNQKFRDRRQEGYGMHLLYWIGLLPLLPSKGLTLPNSFIRSYLP